MGASSAASSATPTPGASAPGQLAPAGLPPRQPPSLPTGAALPRPQVAVPVPTSRMSPKNKAGGDGKDDGDDGFPKKDKTPRLSPRSKDPPRLRSPKAFKPMAEPSAQSHRSEGSGPMPGPVLSSATSNVSSQPFAASPFPPQQGSSQQESATTSEPEPQQQPQQNQPMAPPSGGPPRSPVGAAFAGGLRSPRAGSHSPKDEGPPKQAPPPPQQQQPPPAAPQQQQPAEPPQPQGMVSAGTSAFSSDPFASQRPSTSYSGIPQLEPTNQTSTSHDSQHVSPRLPREPTWRDQPAPAPATPPPLVQQEPTPKMTPPPQPGVIPAFPVTPYRAPPQVVEASPAPHPYMEVTDDMGRITNPMEQQAYADAEGHRQSESPERVTGVNFQEMIERAHAETAFLFAPTPAKVIERRQRRKERKERERAAELEAQAKREAELAMEQEELLAESEEDEVTAEASTKPQMVLTSYNKSYKI